jgi:2-polyprenyl-3-methyl-5-hydroxy-6-metoxy-1,4-benzoquinol methylase
VNLQQTVFSRLYRRSPNVESLPWHREQPPALLERAVAQRSTRGRALDVGCGEGVYSAYLAEQGFSVVGVDFVPAALAAARTRADRAGLELDLHEGDVVDYSPGRAFDVVLDSGCLHHLPKGKVSRYRARLDEWLAPGGDYVLVHFAHRPRVLWIPKGPRHMTRDETVEFFAPLQLRAYEETHFDVPLPMGRMRAGVYWFSRPAR